MVRRTKAAVKAGQPASAEPTEFVGRNDRGAVRPADDRYLEDAELDARDAYLLEHTGPEAQQLVVKRARLRELLDQLTDAQLATVGEVSKRSLATKRVEVLDRLEESANAMPNAQYRELIGQLGALVEAADEADDGTEEVQP